MDKSELLYYHSQYEEDGWTEALAGDTRGSADAGSGGDPQWDETRGRGSGFWGGALFDKQLAFPVSRGWSSGFETKEAGAQRGHSVEALAGSHNGSLDYRSMSGPIEAAVCLVDARGGSGVDQSAIWDTTFEMDGGAISEGMGAYAAEAGAQSVRAGSGIGKAVVGGGVSGDSASGEARGSDDLLG